MKHLNNPGNAEDDETPDLTAGEMKVTAAGQVSVSRGSETVFSLNCRESEKIMSGRQASRADLSGYIPGILQSAKKLSGFREPLVVGEPVFCGRIQRTGYTVEKYYVRGEGDYIIPYLLFVPEQSNHNALIYLHPAGKSVEASQNGEMERFAGNGYTVLAPDLLGTGETGPGTFKGDAFIDGISHNVWYASMLIGRSIVGIRAGDVVRLCLLLKKNATIREIYGFGRKEMAPVLLHAAAFDPDIKGIALIEPFDSYRSIVMNRFYISGFIPGTVPGALREYDLPDLAACLAPRKLMIARMTDGHGEKMLPEVINQEYEVTKKAFENVQAADRFSIITETSAEEISEVFMNWIR